MKDKNYVKDHILNTTIEMLKDGFNAENITIRKISHFSNVSTGLINYHFTSKNNLLDIATERLINEFTIDLFKKLESFDNPKDKLFNFLHEISNLVLSHETLTKILLLHEYNNDSYSTPEHITGLIQLIRPELSVAESKILALQVVAPMQYVFIKNKNIDEPLNGFNQYMEQSDYDYKRLLIEHLTLLGLY